MPSFQFIHLDHPQPYSIRNNRSLWYGEGFFETIRFQGKQAPLLPYHLKRIEQSAVFLGMHLNIDHLASHLLEAVEPYHLSKVNIGISWSGESGYNPPDNGTIQVFFRQEELESAHGHQKLQVAVAKSVVLPSGCPYTFLKSTSALPYTLAARERKQSDADELIILNDKGRVVECISSNIFLLKKDECLTPPISDGCVAGTFRQMVLDKGRFNGWRIREKSLVLTDVMNGDGLILTNALKGAVAVSSANGQEIPTRESAETTAAWNALAGFSRSDQ
jgi:branched-subunit amino acid aminotransferase/4-amino-4-deoxychorismate lyase